MKLLLCLLLLCLGLTGAGAAVGPPRYQLETRRAGPRHGSVSLLNRATRKRIWTRGVVSLRGAYPSDDLRAIAVLDDRAEVWDGRDWYYRLLLWREGEPVRAFDSFPPLRGADVNMWINWSPDRRRFLLHESPVQGDADSGQGNLWCVHVPGMGHHQVRHQDATRAIWLAGGRVRYWTGVLKLDGPNAGVIETPREHRCSN